VAVSPSGTAFVVWEQVDSSGQSSLWGRRYVPGTGWDSAQKVIGLASQPHLSGSAAVAASANGDAIVLWTQVSSVNTQVSANRYLAGTGWQTAQGLQGNSDSGSGQKVVIDATGNALAVWREWNQAQAAYHVASSRFTLAGGWALQPMSSTTAANEGLALASDGSGGAFAVWAHPLTSAPWEVWGSHFQGGSWQTASKLSGSADARMPDVAGDGAGGALVVWEQNDPYAPSLGTSRFAADAWNAPQSIATDAGPISFTYPRAGLDSAGNGFALWAELEHVWVSRLGASGWSAQPFRVETAGSGNFDSVDIPQDLVVTAQAAVAEWSQDGRIWANRLR
jgi:hypothetical protein